jgi:hypothetical protein
VVLGIHEALVRAGALEDVVHEVRQPIFGAIEPVARRAQRWEDDREHLEEVRRVWGVSVLLV